MQHLERMPENCVQKWLFQYIQSRRCQGRPAKKEKNNYNVSNRKSQQMSTDVDETKLIHTERKARSSHF